MMPEWRGVQSPPEAPTAGAHKPHLAPRQALCTGWGQSQDPLWTHPGRLTHLYQ